MRHDDESAVLLDDRMKLNWTTTGTDKTVFLQFLYVGVSCTGSTGTGSLLPMLGTEIRKEQQILPSGEKKNQVFHKVLMSPSIVEVVQLCFIFSLLQGQFQIIHDCFPKIC